MEDVKNQITEENELNSMEEIVEDKKEIVEEKQKRTRRTKAEIEADKLKEEQEQTIIDNPVSDIKDDESLDDTEEKIKQVKSEEVPVLELELEQVGNNVVVKYKTHKTEHKFAPNDKVYVAEFGQKRDSEGFTKLVNSYKFYPRAGEIERVILTEDPIKVQYKLKNRAGSLFDEEDVCHTEEEAQRLCEYKNRR